MPVKNRFAELLPEITAWRRDFHQHPELLFDVHRTAGKVADLCRSFGCDEVVEGIGRTGVVATPRGTERRRAPQGARDEAGGGRRVTTAGTTGATEGSKRGSR